MSDNVLPTINFERHNMHNARTVWLTGRPAAGKTTLANALNSELKRHGITAVILDGDQLRHGLSDDLKFSASDRKESVRRAAHIAALVNKQGLSCIVALVSPISADRTMARDVIGADRFLEVYLEADLHECESRDPKGNYRLARQGAITSFTGVSDVYEVPQQPWLRLNTTDGRSVQSCAQILLDSFLDVSTPKQEEDLHPRTLHVDGV